MSSQSDPTASVPAPSKEKSTSTDDVSSPSTTTTNSAPKVELTPELRERIRKNRERALRIQAERKKQRLEQEIKQQLQPQQDSSTGLNSKTTTRDKSDAAKEGSQESVIIEDCEEWELGLPEWVTKKEAVSKYCLPEGTLAVCEVKTKDNPHRKGWAPMKLFRRSQIRQKAYKRFEGKEGLIAERTKRANKRLEKDMAAADKIFRS